MKPSLLKRLWVYQAERFPVAAMLPMALAFTFSAASYSRLAGGRAGFIPLPRYFTGAFTAFACLYILRVLDEHKDKDLDAAYRPELPVPRGFISLAELRLSGYVVGGLALALNAVFCPILLPVLGFIALYATLMTKEFFVGEWLRRHLGLYLASHMLILPVIDAYTTGLDWIVDHGSPAKELPIFLCVTFMNGVVVEIGRKLRAPELEREGVDTYSKAWGQRPAAWSWMASLTLTAVLAAAAGSATGLPWTRAALLLGFAVLCLGFGLAYLSKPTPGNAKRAELVSGTWSLVMYTWLGITPWLFH